MFSRQGKLCHGSPSATEFLDHCRSPTAHGWLKADGQERDLMRLGGWRSAEVMRKYAENLAEERAILAYRRLSLGDRF